MKKLSLIVALVVIGGFSGAAEYRDFTSADGKSIRARVLRYDARKLSVTIERDNRKTATVPLVALSAEDQQYIKEWGLSKDFRSESSFKIEAKRKEVKDKGESFGGMIHAKKVENTAYEIRLQNRSAAKIDNLEIEYCIYYEQDKATRDKQVTEEGVRYGTLDVGSIPAKSSKELMTESVTTYTAELDADWYYYSGASNKQSGKVRGVWVRINMELGSGEVVTRSYCLPDSLSNSKSWKTSSSHVGMNKGSKKK